MVSDNANFRLPIANWPRSRDTDRNSAIANRQSLNPSATADGTDLTTLSRLKIKLHQHAIRKAKAGDAVVQETHLSPTVSATQVI
jgi:hypothetical protein